MAENNHFCYRCKKYIGTFSDNPKGFRTHLRQQAVIDIDNQLAVFYCPSCDAPNMFSITEDSWSNTNYGAVSKTTAADRTLRRI